MQPRCKLRIGTGHGNDGKQQAGLNLGYSVESRDGSRQVPALLSGVHVEPVALMRLAHLPSSTTELRDGMLIMKHDEFEVRIDKESGAICSVTSAHFLPVGLMAIDFQTKKGLVEEMLFEAHQRGEALPNRYDDADPIGSTLNFALQQLERQPLVEHSKWLSCLCQFGQRLVQSEGVKSTLSEWRENTRRERHKVDEIQFSIPPKVIAKDLGWFYELIYYAPVIADEAFPRGSWPWTLCREVCFRRFWGAADDSSEQFNKLAERERNRVLSNEEFGPVGSTVLANVFQRVYPDSSEVTSMTAMRGLKDLSAEAFLKDIELLTKGDHDLAIAFRAAIGQFDNLDDEDCKLLCELVPTALLDPLVRLIVRRKGHPDEPTEIAITQTLLESWHNGLRETVEAELRRISAGARLATETDDAMAR